MYPDPVLTADLYCAGRLDEALHQVVGPFWRAIRRHEPGPSAYLWTLRSSEGGEHLKVRLHGSDALAGTARPLLQQAAAAFLARLDASAGERPGEAGSSHPDLSLVWTRYRRSHIWLGGGPFLDDDGYISRITRCLAAACERALLLEMDAEGRISHRVRLSALLEGLIAGLAVSVDVRSAYLEYHRDTLLRARARAEGCTPPDFLELFERRVEAMGPAAGALRQSTRSAWMLAAAEVEPRRVDAAWCSALANLLWYISPLCDDPDYALDPAAEHPSFVPLFNVFHGFANQLGLSPAEEAFAHHLLLSVSVPTPDPSSAERERGTNAHISK